MQKRDASSVFEGAKPNDDALSRRLSDNGLQPITRDNLTPAQQAALDAVRKD